MELVRKLNLQKSIDEKNLEICSKSKSETLSKFKTGLFVILELCGHRQKEKVGKDEMEISLLLRTT